MIIVIVHQFFLGDFMLDSQVGEFVAKSLVVDAQAFAFLFAILDLLLEQHAAFNGNVVFGLHILQR